MLIHPVYDIQDSLYGATYMFNLYIKYLGIYEVVYVTQVVYIIYIYRVPYHIDLFFQTFYKSLYTEKLSVQKLSTIPFVVKVFQEHVKKSVWSIFFDNQDSLMMHETLVIKGESLVSTKMCVNHKCVIPQYFSNED